MVQTNGSTPPSGMSWAERAKKAVPQKNRGSNENNNKRTMEENDTANPPLAPTPNSIQMKPTANHSLTSQALNIVAAETQSVRNVWSVRTASTHLSQKQQQQQLKSDSNLNKSAANKEKEPAEEYPALSTGNVVATTVNWGKGKSLNGSSTSTSHPRVNLPQTSTDANPHSPVQTKEDKEPSSIPTTPALPINSTEALTPSTSTVSLKSIPVSTSASSNGSVSGGSKKTKWVPIPPEEMQAAADAALRVKKKNSRNASRSQSQTQSHASSVQNSPRHPFVVVLPPPNGNVHSSTSTNSRSSPQINGAPYYFTHQHSHGSSPAPPFYPPPHQHSREESFSSQNSGSSQQPNPYGMMPPPPMNYYPYQQQPIQPVPQYWYAQQPLPPQSNGFIPRNDLEVIVVQPEQQAQTSSNNSTNNDPRPRPPPPRDSAPVAGAGIPSANIASSVVFGSLDKMTDLSIEDAQEENPNPKSQAAITPSSSFCIGGEPPHVNKPVPSVEDVIVEGGWVFGTTSEPPEPSLSTPMRLDIQRLSPANSNTSTTLSPLVGFPSNIAVLGTPPNPTSQSGDSNGSTPSVLMQLALQPPPIYNNGSYQHPPPPMMQPFPSMNIPVMGMPPMGYQQQPPPHNPNSEWEVKDFGYGFGSQGNSNNNRDSVQRPRRESATSTNSSTRRGRGGPRGSGRNFGAPRNSNVTGGSGYQDSPFGANVSLPPQQPFDANPRFYQPQTTTYYDAFQVNVNSVSPAQGHAPPPVPTPRSTLSFPLDPTRWYLLGQVEYYLSPENMAQDFFLRKQMDSRGWVPISLIASFRRVQQLTPDALLVRDVLLLSTMVQVAPGDEEHELGFVRMGGWEQFALQGAQPTRVREFGVGYVPPFNVNGEYVYDGGHQQPQIDQQQQNENQNQNEQQHEPEPEHTLEINEDEYIEDEEDDVVFIMSRETSTGAFGS